MVEMNKRSATIVAGGLVLALMGGIASRELTLHPSASAAPVRIVVQTTPAAPTVTAPAPTAPAEFGDEESLR
jgi:hypothetical protein